MMHPAEIYNKAKAIIFSILNRDGETAARKTLEQYRSTLTLPSWYGLKAELDFYTKNKSKYTLDPTFDYGIKCDFVGNLEGVNNCRIDITTNLDFKKLEDYEAIQQQDDRKYKIVVMDKSSGEIADIFDLNFPLDSSGQGRLFDIALFMPSSSGKDGLRYDYHQDIISIGSSQPDFENTLKETCTDWFIPDFNTLLRDLPEDIDMNVEIAKHAISSAKAIDKSTNSNIVACAQPYFQSTHPHDGDGEWITKIYWKHPVIANYLDDYIYSDLRDSYSNSDFNNNTDNIF